MAILLSMSVSGCNDALWGWAAGREARKLVDNLVRAHGHYLFALGVLLRRMMAVGHQSMSSRLGAMGRGQSKEVRSQLSENALCSTVPVAILLSNISSRHNDTLWASAAGRETRK